MPRRRNILFFLLALPAWLAPNGRASQTEAGRPMIRSFGTPEIHSKGPVLSFAETPDGSLFVGSNHLVIFDGLRWQLIDIPGAYAFRALAASPVAPQPRVWVGAIGAIGYAERDRRGTWNFVSLSPQLQAAGLTAPGEIWSVSPLGAGAVFVSAQEVLRWDGAHFEQWPLPAGTRLKSCADEHGSVWIEQDGVGLLKLDANGPPAVVRAAETLPPGRWRWLLCPSAAGGDMLVGTDDGVCRLTPGSWELLPELSALVAGQAQVQAAVVAADEIAIGTQKNGVILATLRGEPSTTVNRAGGLGNNTTYGLWGDRRGGIWVGLDDGCARLDGVGSVSVFDSRDGLIQGLPRKTVRLNDATFVLTDKALYRVAPGSATARMISVIPSDPLLNDVARAPGGLWVGGIDGLWWMGGPGAAPELFRSGNVARLAPAPPPLAGLIYTENFSLREFSRSTDGTWSSRDLQAHFNDMPVSLLADARGEVWLSTVGDGIYRFKPPVGSAALSRRSEAKTDGLAALAHYREGRGLPASAPHPMLSEIGGRLFAFTESQALVFDGADQFVPVPGMGDWTVLAATEERRNGRSPTAKEHTAYWLAQSTRLTDSPPIDLLRVRFADGDTGPIRWESLRATGLDTLGEVTSFDLTEGAGGTFGWIGGKGGLLRIDLDQAGPAGPNRDLQLREVRTDHEGLLDLRPVRPVAIGPGPRRIEFSYSAAQPIETAPLAVYYQTRLQGAEPDWSAPERKNTREFTGLPPGDYVFLARRVDRHGRAGPAVSYPFTIVAPWYRRWPALAADAAALVLAGAALLRWRLRLLQRQTERLDRLVARRTRELELSNTAKSEFLENISHEIRNPLNGIVGLVNLLKPDRLAGEDREVARSLQASAEHLRRVSEDVLGFSKLEFGYVTVEEKPFSLGSALREVVELHAEPARRQGGSVILDLPSGDDRFVGDEAKIRTIVGNFIGNALKYAPGTPVVLHAEWADEREELASVYLAVTDRGPGVPADEQELIFQKFVRGSGAKQGGAIGSGIGLAICRALALRLGGAVGVESPAAPGEIPPGSTFHLWLPLHRASPIGEAVRLRSAPPRPAGPPVPPATSENGFALIVDDEDYNRLVLAGLAQELGYRPLTAADGAAALDLARRHPIDVAFLDLELPGTKGDDTARLLRRLPGGDQPVLIATTGQDSEASRQRCRDAGMDGFLLKPFTGEQVRELIAQVRGRRAKTGRFHAFHLYAQGSDKTVAEATQHYLLALDHEMAAILAAQAADDRAALRAAGHRLRTLGALVQSHPVNAAAARLQDLAATLSPPDLASLVAELARETARLKAELNELPA